MANRKPLPPLLHDGEHFVGGHDQVFLAVELQFGAAPLVEDDGVALLDADRGTAAVLEDLRKNDFGLRALQGRVRSGDPDNIEAQAARRYWPALLGPDFRRDRDGKGPNQPLNYDYGVLRAAIARAVCAAGLPPYLGLNHHNRYNAFCLVDDLIEPCRPLVDRGIFNFLHFLQTRSRT